MQQGVSRKGASDMVITGHVIRVKQERSTIPSDSHARVFIVTDDSERHIVRLQGWAAIDFCQWFKQGDRYTFRGEHEEFEYLHENGARTRSVEIAGQLVDEGSLEGGVCLCRKQ